MGGGEDRLHWRVQGSTSSPTGISSRRRDSLISYLLILYKMATEFSIEIFVKWLNKILIQCVSFGSSYWL